MYAYFKTTDTTYSSVIFFQGVIKINNEFNEQNILNFLQSQGIINLDDVRENMKENERQKLLSMHKYKVFFDEKDNRWKTTVPDETKKNGRRLIAKRNKEQLDADLIAYYAQIEEKKHLDKDLYTLEKIFPVWLKYKATQTNSSSYVKRILVDWNKYYKDTDIIKVILADLTYLKLNDWACNIVKKNCLTKKQYYNMSIIMRQCLDYACEPEVGIIQSNQFSRVKINKKLFSQKALPKSEEQVFITNEQQMICEEIKQKISIRPRCISPYMILLNFQLGLRIGEICAIKWSDIQGNYICIQRQEVEQFVFDEDGTTILSSNFVVVPYTKTEAGNRKVYLNQTAKEILTQIKEVCDRYEYYDDDYIYIQSQSKNRGNTRGLKEYLHNLCVDSGVMAKSNHKIRKTYISSLFDLGVNINTIREQAGHEDERTSLHNYCFDQSENNVLEKKLESATNKHMLLSVNKCKQTFLEKEISETLIL